MQHVVQGPRVASACLASGRQIDYAEHGDPGGEAIVLLTAYADT